jgi:hypothetical protein
VDKQLVHFDRLLFDTGKSDRNQEQLKKYGEILKPIQRLNSK